MVFAKDDLALYCYVFYETKMDWYSHCKRMSKQEVTEAAAEVERLCQSQLDIHC